MKPSKFKTLAVAVALLAFGIVSVMAQDIKLIREENLIKEEDWSHYKSGHRIGLMNHPARDMFDLRPKAFDNVVLVNDSLQYANIMQKANALDNPNSIFWEWKSIATCNYGEDTILYYALSDEYYTCVYACLNPDQDGFPPTLMILAGSNDPWPTVWFEMEGGIITLYQIEWAKMPGESDKMACIEKYKIENGAFKRISFEHPYTPFYIPEYSAILNI